MSSLSNKLSNGGRLLSNKPMDEVNVQGEVFKINGKSREKLHDVVIKIMKLKYFLS